MEFSFCNFHLWHAQYDQIRSMIQNCGSNGGFVQRLSWELQIVCNQGGALSAYGSTSVGLGFILSFSDFKANLISTSYITSWVSRASIPGFCRRSQESILRSIEPLCKSWGAIVESWTRYKLGYSQSCGESQRIVRQGWGKRPESGSSYCTIQSERAKNILKFWTLELESLGSSWLVQLCLLKFPYFFISPSERSREELLKTSISVWRSR